MEKLIEVSTDMEDMGEKKSIKENEMDRRRTPRAAAQKAATKIKEHFN